VEVESDRSVGEDAGDGPVDHAEAADSEKRAVRARDAEIAVDQQRSVQPIFGGEALVGFGVAVVDAVNRDSGGGVAIAVSTDRGELSLSTRCVVHRIKDQHDRPVPDGFSQMNALARVHRQREIGSEIAGPDFRHDYPPSNCASAASSIS
jgi:hypothetical protein